MPRQQAKKKAAKRIPICPECGSASVIPVIHGVATLETQRSVKAGKAILADREEWEGMTEWIAKPAAATGADTRGDSRSRAASTRRAQLNNRSRKLISANPSHSQQRYSTYQLTARSEPGTIMRPFLHGASNNGRRMDSATTCRTQRACRFSCGTTIRKFPSTSPNG